MGKATSSVGVLRNTVLSEELSNQLTEFNHRISQSRTLKEEIIFSLPVQLHFKKLVKPTVSSNE